nr:hypothetical protein [Neobacillus sp. 179.-C4.2 HS]
MINKKKTNLILDILLIKHFGSTEFAASMVDQMYVYDYINY